MYIVYVHVHGMGEFGIKTYQVLFDLYGLISNSPIIIK